MAAKRAQVIDAGLTVLREHGLPGFTQPRVAAVAGIRQSHLTYYFPTRRDLLAAVGGAAVERQIASLDQLLTGASPKHAAKRIAKLLTRKDNTRVLLALVQGADQQPELRALFRELADAMRARGQAILPAGRPAASVKAAYLLHAVSVGLAVLNLATGGPDGERRAAGTLQSLMTLLTTGVRR